MGFFSRMEKQAASAAEMLRTPTVFQAGVVFSGTLASAGLRIAVAFSLARALSAREYGLLEIYIAVMDLIALYADSGLHATLVRFMAQNPPEAARRTAGRSLVLKGLLTGLIVLLAALLFPFCRRILSLGEEAPWMYFSAVMAGAFLAANGFALAIMQGRLRYGLYAWQAIVVNLIRIALVGGALALGMRGLLPLSVLFFIAPAAAMLLAAPAARSVLQDAAPGEVHSDGASYGELARFMAPLAALQVIVSTMPYVSKFMLQAMATPVDVANYALAYQLGFIFPLLTGALFTVLLPKVSAMRSADELAAYRRKALRLYPIVMALTLAGVLAGPPVLTLFFGDKYAAAAPILRLMVFCFGLHVVTQPLSLAFYAVGRPHTLTWIYGVQLALLAALCAVLIPLLQGMGAALALTLSTMGAVGAIIVLSGKAIRQTAQP